jgi:Tfp pilus assembly protein FimT
MKLEHKKAFTLMELLVIFVIIGILSLIGIPGLMSQLKDFQVKEDMMKVEQAIKEARSTAITASSTHLIDFSEANTNHGTNGGLIKVKKADGTVISELYLTKGVLYNSGSSNIASNVIRFDFKGQPVGSSGLTSEFTDSNNRVTISYISGTTPLVSKSLIVSPVTGYITYQ